MVIDLNRFCEIRVQIILNGFSSTKLKPLIILFQMHDDIGIALGECIHVDERATAKKKFQLCDSFRNDNRLFHFCLNKLENSMNITSLKKIVGSAKGHPKKTTLLIFLISIYLMYKKRKWILQFTFN